MATTQLPSAQDIYGGTPAPKPVMRQAGYDISPGPAEAIAGAGRLDSAVAQEGKAYGAQGVAIQELGQNIDKLNEERANKQSQLNLARAKAYVLQQTTDLQTRLSQNPNATTDDWNKGFNQIAAQAGQLVPMDNDTRAAFNIGLTDINARGTADIKKQVYDQQTSTMRGQLIADQSATQNLVSDALAAGDQAKAAAALNIHAQMIDGSAAMGAITPEEQAKLKADTPKAVISNAIMAQNAQTRMALTGPSAEQYGPSSNIPLSVRNNNPGNMRGPNGQFMQFDSKDAGLNAMRVDLAAKISGDSPAMTARLGKNYSPTLANVITTWAPPTENDTAGYIASVAKDTGIAPGQVLTKADLDKIIPAMTKVEGGSAASNNFSRPANLADGLDPETRSKIYRDAAKEDAYQRIDQNPAQAMQDIEAGKLGHGLDPTDVHTLKDAAQSAFEKQAQQAQIDRAATEATTDAQNYAALVGGTMTLADVSKIEARTGVTDFTTMARDRLTKDVPKQPREAQLQEYTRLQDQLAGIMSNAGATTKDGVKNMQASVQTVGDYRKFQVQVMGAVRQGLVSDDEGHKFLGNFSQGIMNAITSNSSNEKNKTDRTWMGAATGGLFGYSAAQDPYRKAFSTFDSYLDTASRGGDLAAKKELAMRFSDYLGDYKPTGDRAKDELTVETAIRMAKESFVKDETPALYTKIGTPNAVVNSDGTKTGAREGKSDMQTDTSITAPFTVMRDSHGNRARVYKDGRVEEIK